MKQRRHCVRRMTDQGEAAPARKFNTIWAVRQPYVSGQGKTAEPVLAVFSKTRKSRRQHQLSVHLFQTVQNGKRRNTGRACGSAAVLRKKNSALCTLSLNIREAPGICQLYYIMILK